MAQYTNPFAPPPDETSAQHPDPHTPAPGPQRHHVHAAPGQMVPPMPTPATPAPRRDDVPLLPPPQQDTSAPAGHTPAEQLLASVWGDTAAQTPPTPPAPQAPAYQGPEQPGPVGYPEPAPAHTAGFDFAAQPVTPAPPTPGPAGGPAVGPAVGPAAGPAAAHPSPADLLTPGASTHPQQKPATRRVRALASRATTSTHHALSGTLSAAGAVITRARRHGDKNTAAASPGRPHLSTASPAQQTAGTKRAAVSAWRAASTTTKLLLVVIAAVAVALGMRAFAFSTFYVPSESMANTLQTGDRMVVERLSYLFGSPQLGEVIVFKAGPGWQDDPEHKYFVKRVIATEGDTVACCDAKGRILVNGSPLLETYIPKGVENEKFATQVVPPGHVFVAGDNREDSFDSRARGPISVDDVVGQVRFRIAPLDRIGLMHRDR